jgi:putative ABC transport system permease protein
MIGLTLVSTALVVGASVKATIGSTFERSAKADYFLTDELDEVDFPATLAPSLRELDTVRAATGFTTFDARVDGDVTNVVSFDFDQIDEVLDLDLRAGGFDRGGSNPIVVSTNKAAAIGAHVGDTIRIDTAAGGSVTATVVGLFADQSVLTQDYLLDTSVLTSAGVTPAPDWVAVSIAPGATPGAIDALVADLADEFPYASVETATEFRKRVEGLIDGVLTIVNVMVALAVVIALIGIANTLALSVFERTRELGLVRAVGMTRRQLRRMVRFEAALVAMLGATLGVGLGFVFGFGVVAALPASIASGLSVPVTQILVVMLVAALSGVAAAWMPARRAGRLDVLDAIAH